MAALYKCPGCGGVSLLFAQYALAYGFWELAGLLPYAAPVQFQGLPASVSQDRDEAWKAFNGGLYKASALLARSALQASVAELKAAGKDLRGMIDNLAESGAITKKLAEWAHEVRATGNEAAHEMRSVSNEDAESSLGFLDAFLEDVFVVPHQQAERRRAREQRKAGEVETDT